MGRIGFALAAGMALFAAACTATAPPPAPDAPPAVPGLAPASRTSWTVTVYYTAVQDFHRGDPEAVTGCPELDCSFGGTDLGTYPASFVTAVRDEGTGRTADGRYLNWSSDIGYWLDEAPRDARGKPLRPFESAAADPDVLPFGTRFTIAGCGRDDTGGVVPATVCDRLRAARWTIVDEFTPGLGGNRHIDVYIGEQTGPDFTDSPWYTTLPEALLVVQ